MGIIDFLNLFSDKQAIVASAASTNYIDVDPMVMDKGKGEDVYVEVQVQEAFNTLTSLTVAIQTATDAAFTVPITLISKSVLLADLTLGARIPMGILPEGCLQFVRMYYTVVGTDPTTGELHAAIVKDKQNWAAPGSP